MSSSFPYTNFKLLHRFRHSEDCVDRVAIDSTSQILLTTDSVKIKFWNLLNCELLRVSGPRVYSEGFGGTIKDMKISPDGRLIGTAHKKYEVNIWEFETGKHIRYLHETAEFVHDFISILFSPDGQWVVAGDGSRNVMWDLRNEEGLCSQPIPPVIIGEDMTMSPDGSVIVASSGSKLEVGSWPPPRKRHRIETPHQVRGGNVCISSVAVSPDAKLFAAGFFEGTIKLWRADNYEVVWTIAAHPNLNPPSRLGIIHAVTDLAFSPDSEILISCSIDKLIKFWDVKTGELKHTLTGHQDHIECMALSPDGQFLVTAESQTFKPKDYMGFVYVWGIPQ